MVEEGRGVERAGVCLKATERRSLTRRKKGEPEQENKKVNTLLKIKENRTTIYLLRSSERQTQLQEKAGTKRVIQ